MKKAILIAASLALFSISAFAADEPAASPAPPAGAVKLHDFVGRWEGIGEMAETGKDKQTMTVVMTCVETSGGWGIRCDDAMTGKNMNYLETDLMGYDASGNQVHWYAVTNAGEVHDHVAQWKDDKNLLATHSEKVGSKSIDENITITLTSPTSLTAKSTLSVDGKESQSMTMTMTKAGKEKK
jgi:hypothetical protein